MKISYNWLSTYIDIEKTPKELSALLTDTGLEVENIEEFESIKGGLKGLVIGKVLTCEKHKNATKLSITTVDIGLKMAIPIVCGATNIAKDQYVIVAKVGTILYPLEGEPFKIKKAKIRGEISEGMICAEDEIGLGYSHEGIMVLKTTLKTGTPAIDYFTIKKDYIFEIGLTPNRSDALSHLGTSRDIKAVTKKEIKWPSVEAFKKNNDSLPIEVLVENTNGCPRYSGITIGNIKIKDSPKWLKNRLLSIGLSPINTIVDITNFVMYETGQPLHAFDYEKIEKKKIIVKTLAANTLFTTLDKKERKLTSEDIMICDNEKPMCIGGIFGGIESGISNTTTSIFLESAYFNPSYIRKSAKLHQLKTDASFRFERGVDPNTTVYALKRAAILISELTGGKVSSEIIDIYPKPIIPIEIPVYYHTINRLIGQDIDKEKIHSILDLLDIASKDISSKGFTAIVPTFRVDVTREEDIIEEILRIYGFNKIHLPKNLEANFLANTELNDFDKKQEIVSSYLVSNGYFEIITNSLTKPKYTNLSNTFNKNDDIRILNKISEDLGVMRQSLVFTGLEVIAQNINYKQKNLKFFEFGKHYFSRESKYLEEKKLALFLTGMEKEKQWNSSEISTDFHQLKGIGEGILTKMNLTNIDSLNTTTSDIFDYGISFNLDQKTAIEIGSITTKILTEFGIKQQVLVAIINWDLLLEKSTKQINIQPISKYPTVYRDLSLVINKSIAYQDILNLTKQTEKKLIKSIDVFDLYEGKRIDHDKKAYALKFTLQDDKKTLTEKVINKVMTKLMTKFEKELGATIRQ